MNNQNIKQTLLHKFIGPRANHYLNNKGKSFNFLWSGLIFGASWLLYRKMYANFFLVYAWAFSSYVIGGIIGMRLEYLCCLYLIPNFILFLFGKKIYLNFAMEKVNNHQNAPKYNEKVFLELGGTNWSVPILLFVIQIIIIIMLSLPYVPYRAYALS